MALNSGQFWGIGPSMVSSVLDTAILRLAAVCCWETFGRRFTALSSDRPSRSGMTSGGFRFLAETEPFTGNMVAENRRGSCRVLWTFGSSNTSGQAPSQVGAYVASR